MKLKGFFYTGNQLDSDSGEWWKNKTTMVFCVEWSQVAAVWGCLLDL